MPAKREPETSAFDHPRSWVGVLLPLGFVAVAVGLLASPPLVHIPLGEPAVVDRAALVVAPHRVALPDPPRTLVGGVEENCNACHQIFQSSHASGESLSYHQDITLSHGLNNRCLNCHDPQDRERLTLRDGATVSFAQTPQLCSQCHGTVYRDWQRGTHGKTLGSWITGSEAQHRLNCNDCHDPHSPRYESMAPLPAPNTLRMGEQHSDPHHTPSGARESPLQRWLRDKKSNPDATPGIAGGHP